MKSPKIRRPIVAGLFYPDEPEELRKQIGISKTEKSSRGLILPHGAYEYIAGFLKEGFKHVTDSKPDLIILSSVVHREHEKAIYLPPYESMECPIGTVGLDKELSKVFCRNIKEARVYDAPFMEEHALETILPFLVEYFPEVPVFPLHFGNNSLSLACRAGKFLRSAVPKNILVIASSNLSDYEKDGGSKAQEADELIKAGNLEELVEASRKGRLNVCSAGSILFTKELLGEGSWRTAETIKPGPQDKKTGKQTFFGSYYFE